MLVNTVLLSGAYLAIYFVFGGFSIAAPALLVLIFGAILVWLSVEDIALLSIPAPILVAATFLALALADDLGQPLWRNIASCVVYGGVVYGIGWAFTRVRGSKALSLGETWLIAIGALLLGPVEPLTVVLIASVTALAWLPIRGFIFGTAATAPLPFGPFVAAGIWITLIKPMILF